MGRLQQLQECKSVRVQLRDLTKDLVRLQDLCSYHRESLYSTLTAAYLTEREKLRQELLHVADMLESVMLQPDGFDVSLNCQDISFQFNRHHTRSADALMPLAMGNGFSELEVRQAAVALTETGHRASSQCLSRSSHPGLTLALLHGGYKPTELTDMGFSKPLVKRATAALLVGSCSTDTLLGVSSSDISVQQALLSMGFGAKDLRYAESSCYTRLQHRRLQNRLAKRRKELLQRWKPTSPAPRASRGPKRSSSSVEKHVGNGDVRQRQQFDAFRRTEKRNLIAEAKWEQCNYNCRPQ